MAEQLRFMVQCFVDHSVALITRIADWTAYRLMLFGSISVIVKKVNEQNAANGDFQKQIIAAVNRLYAFESPMLVWGSDLAIIALLLDIAILGIWISDYTLFPFFSRWNLLLLRQA